MIASVAPVGFLRCCDGSILDVYVVTDMIYAIFFIWLDTDSCLRFNPSCIYYGASVYQYVVTMCDGDVVSSVVMDVAVNDVYIMTSCTVGITKIDSIAPIVTDLHICNGDIV